jgi:hypothetical protein
MKFKRLYRRFCDFGGIKLVKEYTRIGLLPLCCKEFVAILTRRKQAIDAYGNIMVRAGQKLQHKYQSVMNDLDNQYRNDHEIGKHSNKVWVCWLQGMERAPLLVQVCYASLCKNLTGREVILLTEDNIKDYVWFPDFIEEKHRKGLIPMPHYTDLLRLELLVKYGGTWIDATVLCTEANTDNTNQSDMLDADLFLFQQLRKDETRFLGISNWFITSVSDQWALKILRDMLYHYWRDYDCVVHYYIFHLFFGMIMEKHPEVAAKMPKHGNRIPHYLSRRMGDKYDDEWMQELKKRTYFHKLSYRLKDGVENSQGTFYDKIIKGGCGNFS